MLLRSIRTGANLKNEFVVLQFDSRRRILFDHLEQIAPSPDVMTLALDVLAGRLALLSAQFLLLALDPFEPGDHKDANGIEI